MSEMSNKAALIKEAQKYLAKGQIEKAIETWERLTRECPDGNTFNALGDLYLKNADRKNAIAAFHKAATFFMDEGFSLKALGLYKKILNINPSDANAFFALGQINEERGLKIDAIKYYLSAADGLAKEGKKEKLFEIYEKIITVSPSNIPFRIRVAETYTKEGFVTEAAKEYFNIARLYEEKEETEKSLEFYQKSLEIQPLNKETILGISHLYAKTGNLDLAIEQMKNAAYHFPQDTDVSLRCAEIYSAAERLDDALSCLSHVTEIDPANIMAAKLIGEIYVKKGEREKAWMKYLHVLDGMLLEMNSDESIKLLESFKDIDPFETGKRLITLYRQHGEDQKAVQELISLGNVHAEKGVHREAVNCYREALLITPADNSLRTKIADLEQEMRAAHLPTGEEKTTDEVIADAEVFLRHGLYDDAQNLLEERCQKEPENIELHLKLKFLYSNKGNRDKAVSECLILSDLYEKTGDAEKREEILKEAYTIDPTDPRLAGKEAPVAHEEPISVSSVKELSIDDYSEEIIEADFYAKQGLKDEAREILEKLLNLFPQNQKIKKRLSTLETIQEEERKPEEKVIEKEETTEPVMDSEVLNIFNEFKKGLEAEIDEKDHETHYNLGLAYKELGLLDDAIKEFQTAQKDPQTFFASSSMLGICYKEKGFFSLAIEALSSAIEKIKDMDESYWAMKYDLAEAYEKNGDLHEAFKLYTEIYGWNAGFRDVPEKINQVSVLMQQSAEKGKSEDKNARISYL